VQERIKRLQTGSHEGKKANSIATSSELKRKLGYQEIMRINVEFFIVEMKEGPEAADYCIHQSIIILILHWRTKDQREDNRS
jgi:hypothetical protein